MITPVPPAGSPLDDRPRSEAEWKLRRLVELVQQGRRPDTVFLGASVLDADIDPDVVARSAPWLGHVFNACLGGSETGALGAWWAIIRRLIQPRWAVLEVHPLMVHGQRSSMTQSVNEALARIDAGPVVANQAVPVGSGPAGTALATDRNLANGHLRRFRDVPFTDGITTLPPDWYEAIGIDPRPNADLDQYFSFVDAVRADVPDVMLVVSPLALHSTVSTRGGQDSYRTYGDMISRLGPARGIPVLDLRPHFEDLVDFADPFHLRSWAVDRASDLVAGALTEAFGPDAAGPTS